MTDFLEAKNALSAQLRFPAYLLLNRASRTTQSDPMIDTVELWVGRYCKKCFRSGFLVRVTLSFARFEQLKVFEL